MKQISRSIIWWLFCSCLAFHPLSAARADGGMIRLSEQNGKYRITVFTSPAPLRAGPVDISVLVQDDMTGEVEPAAQVDIEAVRRTLPHVALHQRATTDA